MPSPLEGVEIIHHRRRGRDTQGPAKLTRALGIDGVLNGHDLTRFNPELWIEAGKPIPDERVTIGRGQSPGGEWLYVKNNEGIVGWVGALFVEGFLAEPTAPFVEPGDALVVTGLVKTELGTPVSGIGFALTQVGFSNRRSDAVTDKEGRFHAYLPSNLTGTWVVEQVSVSCTSNTMDANCNCINDICGEAVPRSVEIPIPAAGELSFVWK